MAVYKNPIWGLLPVNQVNTAPEAGSHYFNDFHKEDTAATTGAWVKTNATNGTAAIIDGTGGIMELDSDSTTANRGIQIQQIKESWKLTAGTRLGFEAKVAVVDGPQNTQFFCGLCVTDTTIFETGENSADDHIGFEMNATSLTASGGKAQFVSEKDGTRTTVANVHTFAASADGTLANAKFVRLGFYYDGSKVRIFVDGDEVGEVTANIPDDEELTISFACLTQGTNEPICFVDWVKVFSDARL